MTDLYIIATMVTKLPKAGELKELLLPAVKAFRQEEGCLGYTLLQDQKSPGKFVTYERWRDADALHQHMSSPTLKQLASKLKTILSEEMSQEFLDPLLIL